MSLFDSVLITGGGGMLAHALSDALRRRGVTPTLVTRAQCDVSDRNAVRQLFTDHRPTLLLNCAAHTKVDQCEDEPNLANAINGDGPGHLAEMSREFATRLTHFSTDFVFDGQSDRPYLPSDRPNPLSAYGRSKLLGENRVQEANPPGWLIVRTAWLFGRHGPCFPQTILSLARAGRSLRVVNDQTGCPTSTVDLAEAALRLNERQASGLFHVTGSGQTTWYEFAKAVLEVFQVESELLPVTTEEWIKMRPRQACRPRYSVLDCSTTTAVTGLQMRPWREALEQYARQLQVAH
jgi:dTDP-4-dehydrorhamnose reductase